MKRRDWWLLGGTCTVMGVALLTAVLGAFYVISIRGHIDRQIAYEADQARIEAIAAFTTDADILRDTRYNSEQRQSRATAANQLLNNGDKAGAKMLVLANVAELGLFGCEPKFATARREEFPPELVALVSADLAPSLTFEFLSDSEMEASYDPGQRIGCKQK